MNKWAKYLREFIVIILSILAAFWLDEWGEEREARALEREILHQIIIDLSNDLSDLKSDYSTLRQGIISNAKIQNYLLTDSAYYPELCFDFYYIQSDEYAYPSINGYRRLQNLKLSNGIPDSIMNEVSDIYESLYPRVSKLSGFYPDITDYFRPYYEQHFYANESPDLEYDMIYDTDTITVPLVQKINNYEIIRTIGYHPKDYNHLKNDLLFRKLLIETLQFRNYKASRYRILINTIEQLITDIELIYDLKTMEDE